MKPLGYELLKKIKAHLSSIRNSVAFFVIVLVLWIILQIVLFFFRI